MDSRFSFTLNGVVVDVAGVSTHTSLLTWLRDNGHTGSKEGCAEGDCGACTVAIVERNERGETTYRAINSCIALLPMLAGREIVTVEGLAGKDALHPVQQAMVECNGSQCGYCTPGFVVSMFEGYYRKDLHGPAEVGDQLNGNLCRCTGYRPIRDAMERALRVKKSAAGDDLFDLRLRKPAPALAPLGYAAPQTTTGALQRFSRPATLAKLLAEKAENPSAELVCGATEIGVYINKRFSEYPALISTEAVPELTRIEKTDEAFVVGGAAPLTAFEEAIGDELPMVKKMLWAFASRQIRNRASLAGNIVTASPIGDTPPLLLALDATVQIASIRGARTVPISEFFVGYRKTVLAPDEVVVSITVPRHKPATSGRRLADSYKVSKRRELDISIVAAAFVVDLDDGGRVTHARLAYGGVAATPARAQKTEAYLTGRAWNDETLAGASALLREEFAPIDDVRSGRAYRVSLCASLFEKFYRGVTSESQDLPLGYREVGPWSESDASRALAHESAVGHVTGAACYVDDVASRRPMLSLWPVMAPHAHAKILRIDASEARTQPGIALVLTAEDIPGANDVGAIRHDEPLLASIATGVQFHGQMVAVVVGESYDACRRAAAKVQVDYAPEPAVLGLREALAKESFHTTPHVIVRGDVDAALRASPHRLEGELEIGGQEHFYLEAQAAYAAPGDDGDVFVSSSTQHPSEIQAVVSHVLAIPRNKVVVEAPRMGGGFGGKETQGNAFAALVALAALRTGKPVRVQLDRDLDMALTGKRHPFLFRYSAGYDDQGHLLALRAHVWNDGGYALDLSESICDRALFHLDNAYYVPASRYEGRVAKTHVVSHTAFRGFGGPQGMACMEDVLDRIARALGLSPEVVRERNLYRGTGESNTTHYGQALDDNRIQKIWSTLKASASLEERRAELAAYNAKSAHIKRGIAMTPVKFGISFTATHLNQAGALVHVYRDGTVQVSHGGTEMGQGLYTKILGIAMRELGLPRSAVRVMKTVTDKVPNTSATAASAGSDLNGQAVRDACVQIRERVTPVARALLEELLGRSVDHIVFEGGGAKDPQRPEVVVPFDAIAEKAYFSQIALSATGFYRTPGIGYDRKSGRGKPFYYFAYGAAVAEVEVDGLSGMKRVRRVDVLHDVGDSLNPGVDRGQIEGAFVQGMGWLTGEELKWDPKGRLLSHSASTYQIPSIGDAPEDFRIALLADATQTGVIHGSKAVGEPPLMLAFSVREAIRDAIAAFGAPGGEVLLPSPATHEAIFATIQRRMHP
jgi:xanthine dehydrogenase molybdopterin binding subunit/xanthine dehydrogenase small subunit